MDATATVTSAAGTATAEYRGFRPSVRKYQSADHEHVLRSLRIALGDVHFTLQTVSPREFTGDPNEGVTEQTFKMMLATAIRVRTPEIRVLTEQEVGPLTPQGGRRRLDVMLRYGTHVEVVELKYVRAGFLKCVAYSSNPRQFYHNLAMGCDKVDLSTDVFGLSYMQRKTVRTTRGRKHTITSFEVVYELGDRARYQASNYVNLMVGHDMHDRPYLKESSVGYTVAIGIGRRIEVFAQECLFPCEDTEGSHRESKGKKKDSESDEPLTATESSSSSSNEELTANEGSSPSIVELFDALQLSPRGTASDIPVPSLRADR